MGFFDLLKDVGSTLYEKGKEFNGDIEKYRKQYENYDTERLKSLFLSSYGARKMAIARVLKDRGITK